MKKLKKQKEIFLLDILDKIDTQSDVFKGNHEAYHKRVCEILKDRFDVYASDGYDYYIRKVKRNGLMYKTKLFFTGIKDLFSETFKK